MSGNDPKGQVFALSPQGDATQLSLTAAEGYLLSRIDGRTPWRLLREIGGIPPEDVDACLSRWLDDGLLEIVGGASSSATAGSRGVTAAASDEAPPVDAAEAPTDAPSSHAVDGSLLDDRLDLSVDVQRRILEFEMGLGRPYHELLGVAKGSEPKVVKRAYFKLSKEFHPDRYFRKQIGDYTQRLERIFKKVLEAHEMLSDPDLCQVENQTEDAFEETPPADAAVVPEEPVQETVETPSKSRRRGPIIEKRAPPRPARVPKPRVLSKRERLRQRMPFKINHAALEAKKARAEEIFRAAERSLESGRLQEAEASIRIAISFDPGRAEFKEKLGDLRIAAAGERARQLLAKPSDRMNSSELLEVLRLMEDVLIYRPHDPELNERAAQVCLQLEKYDDAREYAETLIERTPDVGAFHSLLGRIHRGSGNKKAALAAFETALKYDEEDVDARRAIASARIGAHDAAQGGKS